MTSADGFTWTARSTSVELGWRNITFGNGSVIVVSNQGGGDQALRITISASENSEPAPQPTVDAAAAAREAAAKRETEIRVARTELIERVVNKKDLKPSLFDQADIRGAVDENIFNLQTELFLLPNESRGDINQILKIVRRYEVIGIIGSDRVKNLFSSAYVEVGLISAASKNKQALVSSVRILPQGARDTYDEIRASIAATMEVINARKLRLEAVIARNQSRYER
jgi:hypothetical protein